MRCSVAKYRRISLAIVISVVHGVIIHIARVLIDASHGDPSAASVDELLVEQIASAQSVKQPMERNALQ